MVELARELDGIFWAVLIGSFHWLQRAGRWAAKTAAPRKKPMASWMFLKCFLATDGNGAAAAGPTIAVLSASAHTQGIAVRVPHLQRGEAGLRAENGG